MSKELLEENSKVIRVVFQVNGETVPSNDIFYYQYDNNSGWNCSYWATVVGNWKRDSEYRLVVTYTFSSEVFDGQSYYQPGDYTHDFKVTIP